MIIHPKFLGKGTDNPVSDMLVQLIALVLMGVGGLLLWIFL